MWFHVVGNFSEYSKYTSFSLLLMILKLLHFSHLLCPILNLNLILPWYIPVRDFIKPINHNDIYSSRIKEYSIPWSWFSMHTSLYYILLICWWRHKSQSLLPAWQALQLKSIQEKMVYIILYEYLVQIIFVYFLHVSLAE